MKNILARLNSFGAQPTSIIKAPTATAAIIFSSLSVATLIWSVTAQIPKTVLGTAVLLPSDGLVSIKSPGTGQVIFPFQDLGDSIKFSPPNWSIDAYNFLQNPNLYSDTEIIELASAVLDDKWKNNTRRIDLSQYSGGKISGGDKTFVVSRNQFIAFIYDSARRSELLSALNSLTTSLKLTKKVEKAQNKSLLLEIEASDMTSDSLESLKGLLDKGYISHSHYLSRKSVAADRKSQVAQSQSFLSSLQTKVVENKGQLRNILTRYLHDSLIYPPDQAIVMDFVAPQWSQVNQEQKLATIKWKRPVDKYNIPIFMNQITASQIAIGMKTISTPLGFSSAEIGGIKGEILTFNPIPISATSIASTLSSKGLAELIAPTGSTYIGEIKLLRDKDDSYKNIESKINSNNRGGYVWNNKSNPPLAPRDGILLSTQITTRMQTPLQMLIPVFKEGLGISPPHKLQLLQQGQKTGEGKS